MAQAIAKAILPGAERCAAWTAGRAQALRDAPDPVLRSCGAVISEYIQERGLMGARICLEYIYHENAAMMAAIKLFFERSQT